MATSTIDYEHPYASLYWEHKPTAGSWQNITTLSGYVSGQGTKTVEISTATAAETGFIRCTITPVCGAAVITDEVAITGAATAPSFTVGISNQNPYQGTTATFGPVTVTGNPTPTLYWEAEVGTGSNTWQDADLSFGGQGSGQGTDTYSITNTTPSNDRSIRVTATNSEGNAVSQATLTVRPTLAFTTHPTDKEIVGIGEYLHDFTTKQIGAWNHTRDSNATAPDENGIIQTYTANQPAWYRDQGLQLEAESTSYIQYSSDLTDTWTHAGGASAFHGTITAPDGTLTALHWQTPTTHVWKSVGGAATGDHVSVWARALPGDAGVTTNLGMHNSVPEGTFTLSETWERYSATTVDNGFSTILYAPDSRSGTATQALTCMPQWEYQQNYATSFIYNVGVAANTRAATSCTATFAALGDPLPAGGFTNDFCGQFVFAPHNPSTETTSKPLFSIGDTTNGIAITLAGTTLTLTKYVGGSPTALELTTSAYAANDSCDVRYRISASDMKLWWNVSTTNANANGTALAAAVSTATNENGFMAVSKVRIVPSALIDGDIVAWA